MIYTNNTNVNGVAYDWASLTLTYQTAEGNPPFGLDSIVIENVTSINYGENAPRVANYGKGVYPVSKGRQNVEVTADMTISLGELQKLINIAINGKIQNLPTFNIQVRFMRFGENSPTLHVIQGCSFDSTLISLSQNDPETYVTINLNPMNIKYR